MEKPYHVIQAMEGYSIPKRKKQSTFSKIFWRIFIGITVLAVAFDLWAYGKLYESEFFLFILYIKYTFPKIREFLRIVAWSFLSIVIFFFYIVGENMITFFPSEILAGGITLYIWASFRRDRIEYNLPMEIQFFDDYLMIYREKHYDKWGKLTRKYEKIYYKDIEKCEYDEEKKGLMTIYGKVEVLRHEYNEEGQLIEDKVYQETIAKSCHFYTKAAPEIDFVAELEKHAPVVVAYL